MITMIIKRTPFIAMAFFPVIFSATGFAAELETSGSLVVGVNQVNEDKDNSSKFNEYRDIQSGPFIQGVEVKSQEDDYFVELTGKNLVRKDQELKFKSGQYGKWSLTVDWDEVPHDLSNNAASPYTYRGDGRYSAPDSLQEAIQITHIEQGTADTVAANNSVTALGEQDTRVAENLLDSAHPVDLGTQRQTGTIGFNYQASDRSNVKFEYKRDKKDGSVLTGVSIGDRPPRSLTVQLPEPVDYITNEFSGGTEYKGDWWRADASAVYSAFTNNVKSMTWDSLFYTADAGKDYKTLIDPRAPASRLYADEGRMALSPDNIMQSFNAGLGFFGLPLNSALDVRFARSVMKQNDALLPYATSDFNKRKNTDGVATDWDSVDALPESSANAELETTAFNTRYTLSPFDGVNLNLRYRYYDLNNKTPEVQFDYITGDSSGTGYTHKRVNLAYDFKQNEYGVDLNWRMGSLGTLGLAYENEKIERPYREVTQTTENTFSASYRVNPARWLNLKGKYQQGKREGGEYNSEVTDASYWYDAGDVGTSNQNPLYSFGNMPGLRKMDVADRTTTQYNLSAGVAPSSAVSVNLTYGSRKNDYATGAISSNPNDYFQNDSLTGGATVIDNRQLGLLEDKQDNFGVDLNFRAGEALALFAYYARAVYEGKQRGRLTDEDERTSPKKDWNDNTTGKWIWDAAIKDTNDTFGVGFDYAVIEGLLDFNADFSYSKGVQTIAYTAYKGGAKNWADWSSPPDVEQALNSLKLALSYHLTERMSIGINYRFENYMVKDWQQEGSSAFSNAINDHFVNDTDPDTLNTNQDRQGNRLVRLEDYLAPEYTVHMAAISLSVRF